MRIAFLHASRDPVPYANGPVRIGSHADNDIVLDDPGVGPHHLVIDGGVRVMTLRVLSGQQRVYVNARPVRERALLRFGDVIHLGQSKLLLTSDRAPPSTRSAEMRVDDDTAPTVLRIVSGPGSGKLLPIRERLVLGGGCAPFADVAHRCNVTLSEAGLLLETGKAKVQVNGWACACAWLANSDQIALGEHRLIVEAHGLQRAVAAARVVAARRPVVAESPAEERSPAETWWLIAAAAVLATVIALLLYFRW